MIRIRQFLSDYRVAISAWILMIVLIYAGLYCDSVVALSVFVVGVLGQAFGALIAWIGLVPLVGPMVAHVLSRSWRSGADIQRMCSIIENYHDHAPLRYQIWLCPWKRSLNPHFIWSIA